MDNATTYHKTSDGTLFYTKIDAKNHARSLADKKVEPVSADNREPSNKKEFLNAKETIVLIKESNLESLDQFAQDERKSVQEAYQNRLEELTKANNPQK